MTTTKKITHNCQTILTGSSYTYKSADAARREQRRQCGNDRTIALELGTETVYVGAGQRWLVDGEQVHLVIGRGGALIELVDVSGVYA